MSNIDQRLATLGLHLPEVAAPVGSYVQAVRTGNLVFLSGGLPVGPEGPVRGTVGDDVDLGTAQAAARLAVLGRLAVLRQDLGSLDAISRIVTLNGFVQAVPGYADHPAVLNGASDLLVELFGEAGRHTRTAVGVASLPLGVAVEINLVVEVKA